MGSHSVDWSAVAFLVAEQASLPALLLNAQGEVLLMSPALEQGLGWPRDSIGSVWVDRFVLASAASTTRWLLHRALVGAVRDFETEVLTADGIARARFSTRPVGEDDRGVLLVLERLVATACKAAEADHDYEVQGIASGSYGLRNVWKLGVTVEPGHGTCFEKLHGRTAPCDKCPLKQTDSTQRSSAVVSAHSEHVYVLTTATALGEDGARVSVRHLSRASLGSVMLSRLDELVARGKLTTRERAVFCYLMEGRDIEDIANALGISARTVKFHIGNVLQKLGADSRHDLLRLVFWPDTEMAKSP
jgi:DNA-binding CsgD family transcriptional regulator